MNEKVPWYEIDVKAEVVSRVKCFIAEHGGDPGVLDAVHVGSVRDLMSEEFLSSRGCGALAREASSFAAAQFIAVRNEKYGQEEFLSAARLERMLAYEGRWEGFLLSILSSVCPVGAHVLFVGTADGSEIPNDRRYRFHALEQLSDSSVRIDPAKVETRTTGDFEDLALRVLPSEKMSAVVALRCLMPNTRLNRFFGFVRNNLHVGGHLIASHPMARLDGRSQLVSLPDCEKSREDFEKRIGMAGVAEDFVLKRTVPTALEWFYVWEYAG